MRRLLSYAVHEPVSLCLVQARRVFSWAKNIMPRMNSALPPRLKQLVCNEYTKDALPPGLPALDAFEVHSRRVARVLGGNPGMFTLQGTNCYVVGTGPKRVLIDAGEGRPSFGPALSAALSTLNCTVDRVVITHRHFDHVGGIQQVRELLPHPVHVRKLIEERFKFDPGRYNAPADVDEGYDGSLKDGERIRVDDETTLRVWHTPGHCEDHCCFILEEERAIFSGDNVLGVGSSWFEDLAQYMRTLNDMLRASEDEKLVALYPGHGPPAEPAKAKISEYVSHREKREAQVRDALPPPPNGLTSCQIVLAIYPKLPPYLFFAAQANVLAHLNKLAKDGDAKNLHWDLWAANPGNAAAAEKADE